MAFQTGSLTDKLNEASAEFSSNAALNQEATTQEVANNTTSDGSQNSDATVNSNGQAEGSQTAQDNTSGNTSQADNTAAATEEDFSTFTIPVKSADEAKAQIPANTVQVSQKDWREIVKGLDRKEVMKELGYDDFTIELGDYRKDGGDVTNYLSAKAIDYNKVSDTDLMKREFASKYPHLEATEQEYLFNKKYGITEFDEEDVQKDKQIALKADAYEIRQKKITEQQSFKLPDPLKVQAENKEFEDYKKEVANYQAEIQHSTKFIEEHPATKAIIDSKRVSINLGEGVAFNVAVDDPRVITSVLTDANEYDRLKLNDKGELNVELLNQVATLMRVPDLFKRIFNYGKAEGKRSIVAENQNAKRPVVSIHSNGNGEGAKLVTTNGSLYDKIRTGS